MTAVLSATTQQSTTVKLEQFEAEARERAASSPAASSTVDDGVTVPSANEDLILNTGFDFQNPVFASQLLDTLEENPGSSKRKAVSDHVLANGERVVVVDPNVSDDEENNRVRKAVKAEPTKRSVSPATPVVIPVKRRRVDRTDLFNNMGFMSAAKSLNRNSSSLSGASLNDSGVVSGDEQGSSACATTRNISVPAPLLKLLLTAAAGGDVDTESLSELLSQSPELLEAVGDALPSCSKPREQEVKAETTSTESTTVDAVTLAKLSTLTSAEQITTALALWPNATLDDLAQRAFALGSGHEAVGSETSSALQSAVAAAAAIAVSSTSGDSRMTSAVGYKATVHSSNGSSQQKALDEFLKQNSVNSPKSSISRATPRRRHGDTLNHLKSSESVLSQLRSHKGEPLAELEELEQFAQNFKRQRIKHGFTQGDVGVALGRRYGTDFSQTTISRFEALNLSFKNMCKLRPLMEEWMNEAEAAIERGASVTDIVEADTLSKSIAAVAATEPVVNTCGIDDHSGARNERSPLRFLVEHQDVQSKFSPDRSPPVFSPANMAHASITQAAGLGNVLPQLKKRRKRTNLDARQKDALDAYFLQNSRPDHTKMGQIGVELDLDPDVVRVWFCNRRQKLRKVV